MSMSFVVTCRECGQKLRVPSERAGEVGRCGKCGWSFRVNNDGAAVSLKSPTRLLSRRNVLIGAGLLAAGGVGWWALDSGDETPADAQPNPESDYVPGPVPDGEFVRIACVGDSITAGNGLAAPKKEAYPAQLQARLGHAYEVVNFAVGGRAVLTKADFPYTETPRYAEALAYLPHRVVLVLGTNDGWPQNWAHIEEFPRDYARLLRSFRELPTRPRLYLGSPPPVFGSRFEGLNDSRVREIATLIRKEAARLSLPFIDLHTPFQESPHLFPDGLHPNAEGAKRIAGLVARTLEADGVR